MNTMNRHTTLIMTTLAFLYLGIALRPSDALGQQKTLKELIVGTWILESGARPDRRRHKAPNPGVLVSKGSRVSALKGCRPRRSRDHSPIFDDLQKIQSLSPADLVRVPSERHEIEHGFKEKQDLVEGIARLRGRGAARDNQCAE